MTFKLVARNNGIFLGMILIVFSLVLSYVNPAVFLNTRSFIMLVPFFIILMKNAFDLRRINDGVISFRDLFLYSLLCSVIAIILCTSFEYTLFNFFYPELKDVFRAVSIEALEQSGTILGDDYKEKVIKNLEEEELYNFAQIISLFFTRLIAPGALLSGMAALMFKKSKIITDNQ
jgi:hypothetical protein